MMKLNEIVGYKIYPVLNSFSIVVDIGAHIGSFARATQKKFHCRVWAHEPNKTLFLQLEERSRRNGKIFPRETAVTAKGGEVTFTDYGNDGHSGSVMFREGKMYTEGERYKVTALSLDKALWSFAKVDLLKLNCEGSEVDILREADEEALKKCEQIAVHFHVGAHKGFSPAFTHDHVGQCSMRLASLGFDHVQTGERNPTMLYYKKEVSDG